MKLTARQVLDAVMACRDYNGEWRAEQLSSEVQRLDTELNSTKDFTLVQLKRQRGTPKDSKFTIIKALVPSDAPDCPLALITHHTRGKTQWEIAHRPTGLKVTVAKDRDAALRVLRTIVKYADSYMLESSDSSKASMCIRNVPGLVAWVANPIGEFTPLQTV